MVSKRPDTGTSILITGNNSSFSKSNNRALA